MKRKFKADLTINLLFQTEQVATSVWKATSPENQETPSNVISEASLNEKELVIHIEAQEKFMDLITTMEDYFEKIDLSRKTIEILDE
jgi:tRNA threonylcarbamoyladenosine modification (KEOPS) complex  Pcc1 subunit